MALGDSKYGVAVKFNYNGEGKSKTLSYVNYNDFELTSVAGGSSAYGIDDNGLLALGNEIASLTAETSATAVYLTRENEVQGDD